ncbi:MAG: repeat protein [Chlorobi bacterium]|nr:repeat protein [Chlorobiota bacterium]
MHRFLYRFVAFTAFFAVLGTVVHAQTQISDDRDNTDGVAGTCGMMRFSEIDPRQALAATARNNPDLYRNMMARARSGNDRSVASGQTMVFYTLNRSTNQFDAVTATLVYDGHLARIWVDQVDSSRVKPATVAALAKGLDSATGSKSRNPAKGIIDNDIEVYGETPKDYEVDGKTDFLLTDIKDGMSGGGYIAGYFSPYDQGSESGSNERNILYIDSHEGLQGGVSSLLATIAHEFQHLIHYGRNPYSEVMFNEGCSEVATVLCGYTSRSNSNYLSNTNVSFLYWNYDNGTKLLADYERALTFMYYMKEQYGEPFLNSFVGTESNGFTRINDALKAIGKSPDWQGTLKSFSVANYVLKDFSDSRYVYVNRLSNTIAKAATTYDTAFASSGSVSVQPYASSYIQYKNPGGLKVRFKSSGTYGINAILYKGSIAVDVRELKNNTDYSFSEKGLFDRIVFAVVNLGNNAQSITWTAEHIALGVDDAVSQASGVAVTSIAPTPTSGHASVAFESTGSAPVTLQLFNTNGELVRNLIDAERYESGTHQIGVETGGLSNGVYVVRLVQGDRTASRVMVVVR